MSSGTDYFTIKTTNPHVIYEAQQGDPNSEKKTKRWYWHRKVNGEIAAGNSVSSRRSCRRACLQDMRSRGEELVEDE